MHQDHDDTYQDPGDAPDIFAGEYSERHRGLFGRYRAWRERSRARLRNRWLNYLLTAVPEDDDAPEKLPAFLHGPRGRVILAVTSISLLVGWLVATIRVIS